MLLKISLGLAILLGVATIFLTHTQLGGKINQLTTDLQSTQTQLTQTQASETKLRGDVKTLRATVDENNQFINETTNALAQAQAKAVEQQTRADRASQELNTVTAERNTAQAELAQWRLFEMSPEQIRNSLTRLRNVERERDVFVTDSVNVTQKDWPKLRVVSIASLIAGAIERCMVDGSLGDSLPTKTDQVSAGRRHGSHTIS